MSNPNEIEKIARFDNGCSVLRNELKALGDRVKAMKQHADITESAVPNLDTGEMLANIMLAYRHIEDAAMRLGKAIQAFDGGKSVYDPLDTGRFIKALAEVSK